ncbi:MAG: class I SAM-dependent methyltransferase [Chitinophagaceae bacterium]|nr:class I SAM-dependent methyltransferase [Chitinophagaceae bacterium]
MHSPFVFDFITKVMNDTTLYPDYGKVEELRRQLLRDNILLDIVDMGAGSGVSKTTRRSVASIAKSAAKPQKFGQLLYRLVKYYQPGTIIELGSSLGITTSYLSLAKPDAKLITMEGAGAVAAAARKNFSQLRLTNITLTEGNFDETLQPVLDSLSSVDFCFIDGNHRQEPTERYFRQLLPKLSNDSIVIFDDIHWSHEMEQAWESIQRHEAVRCTVDLFFIGIVFFRQEFKEKRHFKIRF